MASNKKGYKNEADTRADLIDPKLYHVGWSKLENSFTHIFFFFTETYVCLEKNTQDFNQLAECG